MNGEDRLRDYLDGDLPAAESEALLRQVETDAVLRARLIGLARLDRELASELAPIDLATGVRADLLRDGDRYTSRVMKAVRQQARRKPARRRPTWLLPLAAAAVLALMVLLVAARLPATGAAPLAVVATSDGPLRLNRAGAYQELVLGAALHLDDRIEATVDSGLRYADGTEVRLAAGTAIRLTGDAGVELRHGSVRAQVTKQLPGRSMRFTAPHLVATVIGTRLELSSRPESSRMTVSEGLVRVEDRSGHAAEIAAGGWAEAGNGSTLATGQSLGGRWAEIVTGGTVQRDAAGTVETVRSIPVDPATTNEWFKPDQTICVQGGELGVGGRCLLRLPDRFVLTLRLRAERAGNLTVTLAPEPPHRVPNEALGANAIPVGTAWSDIVLTADSFKPIEGSRPLSAGYPLWTLCVWGFDVGQVELSGITMQQGRIP